MVHLEEKVAVRFKNEEELEKAIIYLIEQNQGISPIGYNTLIISKNAGEILKENNYSFDYIQIKRGTPRQRIEEYLIKNRSNRNLA